MSRTDTDSLHTPLRLGLGLAAVGRPAYITAGREHDLGEQRGVGDLRRRCMQVLDAAYAGGIRYLDVARSYGRAEEFLAAWLSDHPQVEDVVIGSKWGYRYVGGWRVDADVHEVKDHSLTAFTEQLGQTQALLGGRLDVYHVHSATLETGVLDDTRLHRELAKLRETGVRVGVSTSGPGQAQTVLRALDVMVDGEPLFTSIQSTWNPLEPAAGPALQEAAARGARVIVKEALANGRLAPGGDDGTAGVRRATQLAEALGLSIDQLAIAAAAAQPWAWRVLSGAATPEQVTSNLAGAQVRLPPDWLTELESLAQPPHAYWADRSQRPWT